MIKKKLNLGLVDGYGIGRKNCEANITFELTDDGKFSMQAEVWKPNHNDIIMGGQCVDEVLKLAHLSKQPKYKTMIDTWNKYHLNDLQAGTPEQTKAIEQWVSQGNKYDYTRACEYLKSIGLYEVRHPSGTYELDTTKLIPIQQPVMYKYGHEWLKLEIPQDVIDIIKSW
jgi:hypothetical protein